MLEVLKRWYQTRFSDPDAVTLFLLLVFCFTIIWLFGDLLAPLLVALVMAYLLEWPVARLQKAGLSRTLATSVILILFIAVAVASLLGLIPTLVSQGINLAKEAPAMLTHAQDYVRTLPDKYPELIDVSLVETVIDNIRQRILSGGEHLVSASLSSLVNVVAIMIYLILVPLMVFFMLKDKRVLMGSLRRFLPRNRTLVNRVWVEMNNQIINYIRGKVIEILIVGIATYVPFALMGLRYSVLLAVAVGFSVLIPYIGAAVVTVPVAMVALFQWGLTPEFAWLMVAYLVIQALDGNLLVPVLFSEAVNLHPVAIIIAVLVFGGLWGFWGVFFAIPLATLVKAVINAWPKREEMPGAAK
ncbi:MULTISPECIES: AI-2E family transporter [Aeromonas]|uniref:AI-2E family transporter n=2 Tax=Aeromonas veronii TaxID=654 RepID=A0A0T6SQ90_AERVE|nr:MULTISPECIES: AI-2E family transporter [Aeromonas]HDN9003146.1 AI-2E family transporter [Aeromonas veronii AMC24]AMQ43520.1 permease [Aeromonas veronii]ATY77958.1 AI-2E family transporter [Aeromonas veronii]AYK18548.1 AI-2E family transporter [Aeromonas veronii]AYV36922.1 AI-2E family transporter [Aeromonas veronii]